jgi:HlyD family secretion protein
VETAKVNLQVAELNLKSSEQRIVAELASAKARAADARAKALRTEELFKAELASREELETAQTSATQAETAVTSSEVAFSELQQQKMQLETRRQDIKTAEATKSQDEAKLALSQRQLEYTKVYVPDDEASKSADYRVAALTVQLGTIVQSGSSGFSGGTTVMTLSDVSHMFVLASVDESDIGQVSDPARGGDKQRARVTVDAYPGVEFEGEVVRVATKGVNATNVVTFEVKIEVTSPNKTLLRPEMTATARIIGASRPDVLAIPMGAFTRANVTERAARAGSATAPAGGLAQATTAPAGNPGDAASPVAGGAAPGVGLPADLGPAPGGRRGGGRGGPGGGRGGRGGAGRGGMAMMGSGAPMEGTVQVQRAENQMETREVVVGLTDDAYYEVIRGLEEGETVVVQRTSAESRWRNPNQSIMPRGMGGGGRGR